MLKKGKVHFSRQFCTCCAACTTAFVEQMLSVRNRWKLASVKDALAMGGKVSGKMLLRALVTTLPEAHFEAYGEVRDGWRQRVEFVQRLDWYANQTGCLPPSRWQKFCRCSSADMSTRQGTTVANASRATEKNVDN